MSSRKKTKSKRAQDFGSIKHECVNKDKHGVFDRIRCYLLSRFTSDQLIRVYESLPQRSGGDIENVSWDTLTDKEAELLQILHSSDLSVSDMRSVLKLELDVLLPSRTVRPSLLHEQQRLEQIPCERVLLSSRAASKNFCAQLPYSSTTLVNGEKLYFLPPSAVRRRKESPLELLYGVQMKLINRNKHMWQASFYQVNQRGDVAEIGSIDIDANGVLPCAHTCVFRPIEFCIDEVKGRLFGIHYKKTTGCVVLYVLKLSIVPKTASAFAKVKKIERSLKKYKNAYDNDSCDVPKPPNLVGLSHFAISPDCDEEARFMIGFKECTSTGEEDHSISMHTETVVVDVLFTEKFGLLIDWTCTFFRGSTLGATVTPSLWQIHENYVIGQLTPWYYARNDPIDDIRNVQRIFRFPFDVETGPPQELDQVYALLNFAAVSSLPKDANFRMLLIGRVGHYLLFADATHSAFVVGVRALTVRPPTVPHDRANVIFRHVLVDMSSVLLPNKRSLSSLTGTVRWVDFDGKLYIQAADNRLYSVDLGDVFREARKCATCGKSEAFKRKNRAGQPISQFKVCKMCKNLGHHKFWWIYPCHFCSIACFSKGWLEHVQFHESYTPN